MKLFLILSFFCTLSLSLRYEENQFLKQSHQNFDAVTIAIKPTDTNISSNVSKPDIKGKPTNTTQPEDKGKIASDTKPEDKRKPKDDEKNPVKANDAKDNEKKPIDKKDEKLVDPDPGVKSDKVTDYALNCNSKGRCWQWCGDNDKLALAKNDFHKQSDGKWCFTSVEKTCKTRNECQTKTTCVDNCEARWG